MGKPLSQFGDNNTSLNLLEGDNISFDDVWDDDWDDGEEPPHTEHLQNIWNDSMEDSDQPVFIDIQTIGLENMTNDDVKSLYDQMSPALTETEDKGVYVIRQPVQIEVVDNMFNVTSTSPLSQEAERAEEELHPLENVCRCELHTSYENDAVRGKKQHLKDKSRFTKERQQRARWKSRCKSRRRLTIRRMRSLGS